MMKSPIAELLALALATSLAACGSYGGSSHYTPPGGNAGAPAPGGVGAMTIGFALPSGAIGTVSTPFGVIGGYTQSVYSQVIAFPPGTTVTLKNLSSATPHTLNVLSTSSFPSAPMLSTSASGGNVLASGFASGAIAPGATMSVKLTTPGTYFVGCAFHYMTTPSMRGVIQVSANATPGPQATPQPSGGGAPGTGSGY